MWGLTSLETHHHSSKYTYTSAVTVGSLRIKPDRAFWIPTTRPSHRFKSLTMNPADLSSARRWSLSDGSDECVWSVWSSIGGGFMLLNAIYKTEF